MTALAYSPHITPYRAMEGRSQSSKGLNNEAWKDEIDTGKIGAGYFLSLKGRPDFDPLEYVSFRGLTWAEAERLLPAEWTGWVQDLKTNTYKHIQRRAVSAPILTVHDIYNFYKNQLLDHHELGILGESSQQVVSGGHQLASLLQERQRYPNRTTTSASVPESQGENALLAVSPASERTKGKTVMAPCATEGDLTGGSHERPEADEAVDTLGELESGHRKRQATESEAARKTKNRKKAPNGEAMAAMHKAHIESRKRRYNLLDKTLFWRLESGRAVETVLHDASLQLGATTRYYCQKLVLTCSAYLKDNPAQLTHGFSNSICSYVIDVSCRTTKALFEDDEWNEILIKTRFDLPQLPQPTLLFLDRLRQSVLQGKHPNYVPLPNSGTTDPKDLADCILAQKTAAEWYDLSLFQVKAVWSTCGLILILVFISTGTFFTTKNPRHLL
ncbi:MAG: hypothetical protein J3R72DRAFT_233116 [Linnemannia gamsii]|nr:MAG: hypothetical protein J3R72DRAFT_233116 [Linnemannia gamsii]